MNPLTIHLIIKNSEKHITKAIESLQPLDAEIIAADVGCKDRSYAICRRLGVQVIRLSFQDDWSSIRNQLVAAGKYDWQFYLDPNEALASGHQDILRAIAKEPAVYNVQCLQGTILSKEARLWHRSLGCQFVNPVYEYLEAKNARSSAVTILRHGEDESAENLRLIAKWKERHPLAKEPYYYQACAQLVNKEWDKFVQTANYYLFNEKKAEMPLTMTRYYLAMIQCYKTKDIPEALRNVLTCLAKRPLMAEFWCLLGDIYYQQKKYEEAKDFYENAPILGSRRLKNDDWPMDVSKYRDYPLEMMSACQKIIRGSKYYGVKKSLPTR
jgi:glycosyltransferase involved in cell wall biosynthesis